MIEKWEVRKWSNTLIKRSEFARETPKFLVDGKGKRHAKDSSYESYHDTFEEAKAYLVTYGKNRVQIEINQLADAKAQLVKYEALERPE